MKTPVFLLLLVTSFATAQDSVRQRKNTIKIDLTSRYLYSNAFVIAYERIIKPNRSLVVYVGYQEFPRTSHIAKYIEVLEDRSRFGYKIGVDYRRLRRRHQPLLMGDREWRSVDG